MCNLGDVMNAAMPSGLKLNSESKIVLNNENNGELDLLNSKELLVVEALANNKSLSLTEISKLIDQKSVYKIVNDLIEKNFVLLEEELVNSYKPKYETFIELNEKYASEDNMRLLFDELKKAPKQLDIIMAYIYLNNNNIGVYEIKKSELLEKSNSNNGALNSLIKKNILISFEKETSRFLPYNKEILPLNELNSEQQNAFTLIKNHFNNNKTVLLHGITSSGKTEVYIKLIDEYLKNNKHVLYLLPEIALTTQIINRLRKFFGEKVKVYHSKFNQNERVEIWENLIKSNNKNEAQIIIGPRSALFLPFNDLGLIIVDEEHDTSYKQQSPAPRYNARDTSLFMSTLYNANVLLGSATPSVETYSNAFWKKFEKVDINARYGNIKLPEILVVDLRKEYSKSTIRSHFSTELLNQIKETTSNGEQVILFQNRRGYSPMLECAVCGWVPHCKHCDVSLTYHKGINSLKCHYCGYTLTTPEKCNACGSSNIVVKGFGTEKIEDELSIMFPDLRIARMDLDTTSTKNAHQKIINDFEDKNIDILIGTQMITKGLDFDNVGLVGVMNANHILNFPDFRSFERSFQLMVQVSGRAGRKTKQGKVIIQTYTPSHPIIKYIVNYDYENMVKSELIQRSQFKYPPYYKLIQLTLKSNTIEQLNFASNDLALLLRKKFEDRVLGPEFPFVTRIKNMFQKQILIKIEKEISLNKSKEVILHCIELLKKQKSNSSIQVIIDVDPL